ncbi:MAG: sugar phosphate isomerase/epimerase family protein [Bacillota bacterium]
MKVSCLPVSLFSDITQGRISLKDWAEAQERMGLDGIDVSMAFFHNHTPAYMRQTYEMLQKAGAQIVMAAAYPDFTHPAALQREREAAYFIRDIALCSQLGIPYIRGLAGQAHPGVTARDGIRWAVEGIRRCAEAADRMGVTMLYENHSKPSAWDYVDFSHPTGIFLAVAEGIRGTGVRINFDTANTLVYGDDPLSVLAQIIDRVETVHVADVQEKGKLSSVTIGTGAVPLREIFTMLKQHGFDGWLCIEEASDRGFEGIREAVRNVRTLWEQV